MALYVDTALRPAPAVAVPPPRTAIWSEPFDAALLVLPLVTGLVAAGAVLVEPRLFAVLLVADLWLLGYHHVVATYTRLAFTSEAIRRNRFVAVDLLIITTALTLAVALTAGAWVVATAFLYLQWFHYMRQGYGIARMYFRATPDGQRPGSRDLVTDAVIYLVPVYAIAVRSSTMGDTFLALPVEPLALPASVTWWLGAAAAVAVAAWLVRSGVAFLRGTLDVHYASFVLSHMAIFMVAYVAIANADFGWLAINVWHNLQYVLVVWMVNGKKFSSGVDPSARLLSSISQPGRAAAYFLTCLGISTVIYLLLGQTVAALGGGLALTVGVFMGINFHHYVVDALIWKRKRVVTQAA